MSNETITAAAIRQWRERQPGLNGRCLSREALAQRLGASASSVKNWESGAARPMEVYRERLVALLGGETNGGETKKGGLL